MYFVLPLSQVVIIIL